MVDFDAAMQRYYALDKERDRLAAGAGRVEFLRTVEVMGRTLSDPPAVIADIGGGPGRYTDWLVERGHRVVHRDLVARHVDHVRARHGAGRLGTTADSAVETAVDTAVGDARALDLADDSVDGVLLLGPLYHLPDPVDRAVALAEAIRVVKPGGTIHVAAISRWAARLDGILVSRIDRDHPVVLDQVDRLEQTGRIEPVAPGGFNGYTHTPEGLRRELTGAGLSVESLVNLEGIAFALGDLDQYLGTDDGTALLLDMLRAVESVPDLLGVGPHLLAACRTPSRTGAV